jgi:hypothetical protein
MVLYEKIQFLLVYFILCLNFTYAQSGLLSIKHGKLKSAADLKMNSTILNDAIKEFAIANEIKVGVIC